MRPVADVRLRTRDAIAIGLLHGPTELLPISSSAHVTLVPWLLGWPYAALDGEQRKAFEVALHAGALAALLVGDRAEVARELRSLDGQRIRLLALSALPPALAGLTLGGQIERRLGTPRSIANGLVAGALAMAAADSPRLLAGRARRRAGPRRTAGRRHSKGRRMPGATPGDPRRHRDAGPLDALALGLAQTCALVPGVSRSGATLTAARARGFAPEDASVLSRQVALPVIAGATALQVARALRSSRRRAHGAPAGPPAESAAPHGPPATSGRGFAAGALASFAATLASIRLLRAVRRDRPLWPYAAYRIALAGLVFRRLRTAHAHAPDR
jgi:undecaprenyl-diphosphatase